MLHVGPIEPESAALVGILVISPETLVAARFPNPMLFPTFSTFRRALEKLGVWELAPSVLLQRLVEVLLCLMHLGCLDGMLVLL